MDKFKLRILTPQIEFFSGEAEAIRLKGMEGYFQILAKHMDFMSVTVPHEAKINLGEEEKVAYLDGAVVKVRNGEVTVLSNKAEWINR